MSYREISTSRPKAQKEYGCEWCGQRIEKGEVHFQRSYHWEGEFTNGRMHLECEAEMNKAPRDEIAEGWIPGDFGRPPSLEKKK